LSGTGVFIMISGFFIFPLILKKEYAKRKQIEQRDRYQKNPFEHEIS
jgi:hypothetical protein